MALCLECSPAVQEVPGSMSDWSRMLMQLMIGGPVVKPYKVKKITGVTFPLNLTWSNTPRTIPSLKNPAMVLTLFKTKIWTFLCLLESGYLYHISREIRRNFPTVFLRLVSVKKAEWVRARYRQDQEPAIRWERERENSRQSLRTKSINQPLTCSEREQGWYSKTGFHIVDMDRNLVCLWRRHNCRSQVIDISLSVRISWFIKSIIGFLNNSNIHATISTLQY